MHRFTSRLPGTERRDCFALVIEIGFCPNAPWGQWTVSLRARWLPYSPKTAADLMSLPSFSASFQG